MRPPRHALVIAGVVVLLAAPLMVGSGHVLSNDSVSVPEQDLQPWMWGSGTAPPRSVPQDAVVAVLDDVIPGWVIQRAMIVGALLLLGFGVARLLRDRPTVERVCAATVAVWSTYVFERMSMGHWGLLLGVAAMPWVISATADARDGAPGAGAKAIGWAALGSLVPTAGALQLLTVSAVIAWPGPRALRPCATTLVGVVLLQLVWIVPGILNPGVPSDQTAGVFGVRAEGTAGPVLTVLVTGGIWNGAAMPQSRDGVMSVVAALVLLAAAIAGAARVRVLRGTVVGPLTVMAGLGLAWALATAVPAWSEPVTAVQSVPGGGLLRDAQKWLAPWLILLALAAGMGLARLAGALRRRRAAGPGVVLAVLIPLVLLPDLAFGMWGRLHPVHYPSDWDEIRTVLAESDEPGDVLSWPWSAFRAYEWNRGQPSLDPAPRYLPRTVVTDTRLLVTQDGELVVVPSDDTRSSAVADALRLPDAPERLAALGVGWLLVQADQPASPGYPSALPDGLLQGSTLAIRTPTLELRRLTVPPIASGESVSVFLRISWAAWFVLVAASSAVVLIRSALKTHRMTRMRRQSPATLRQTDRR